MSVLACGVRLEDHLLTQQLFAWSDVITNSNKLFSPQTRMTLT